MKPLASGAGIAGIAVCLAFLPACADPHANEASRPPATAANAAGARPHEYSSDDKTWGKFHSKRFQLTLPLPDGHSWKIDDHRGPELVAVHAATDSRVTLVLTQEEDLVNRHRCEERARERRWFDERTLSTVEDRVQIGPDAYDSRVWVAIEPTKDRGIVGHVFLFGAFMRRCLIVHLTTSVPSRDDEGVLAARLAVASARLVGGITLDPLRTTDSATVPRDKPVDGRSGSGLP